MEDDVLSGNTPYDQLIRLTLAVAELNSMVSAMYEQLETDHNIVSQTVTMNRHLHKIVVDQTRVILGLKAELDQLKTQVKALAREQ